MKAPCTGDNRLRGALVALFRHMDILWLIFLGAPLLDLFSPGVTPLQRAIGGVGLAAFLAIYLPVLLRRKHQRLVLMRVVLMSALSALLVAALGPNWDGLFIYVSVAVALALPFPRSIGGVGAVSILLTLVTAVTHQPWVAALVYVVLTPMIGASMVGMRRLVEVSDALRRAQAETSRLAAAEERLRIARDVHDLLGHSLSVITLKAQLAARLVEANPAAAAHELQDIEQAARDALKETRMAVMGYRQPELRAELVHARRVLADAGIACVVPERVPDLPAADSAAFAYAVREAVTNVVRHSAAQRCTIHLTQHHGRVELTVADDGVGADGAQDAHLQARSGHGLTGLAERFRARKGDIACGCLDDHDEAAMDGAGVGPSSGFHLRAWLPAAETVSA